MSIALPLAANAASVDHCDSQRLTFFERAWLLLGIVEIPLQIDKYFMFHEYDSTFGALAGFNLSVTTLALVVLYWLWMSKAAVDRQRMRAPLNYGATMLFYMLTVLLSAIVATKPLLSMSDLFLLSQSYLLFFYLANRIRGLNDLYFCVACLAATILVQSFLIFGMAALGSAAYGNQYDIGPLMLSVSADGRANGSMHSPVLVGTTLAILWLPCLGLSLAKVPKHYLWLGFASVVAGLLAIFLTQTRGAILSSFLGTLLVGAALFTRRWLPRWTLAAALLLLAIIAYPLYTVLANRVIKGDDGSAVSRVHLSAIAIEMIADQPILGYGAGNCHLAEQRYADQAKYRAEWFYTIHCKYLLVWIETGIIGLVLFLALLGKGVWQGFASWRSGHRSLSVLGIALSAAILGHMLHMFVDIFNSRSQVQILWVILGLVAAVWKLSSEFESASEGRPGYVA